MSRRNLAASWTLVLAAACAVPDSLPNPDRETQLQDEVRTTVEAFVDALNAHDPEAIMEFYAPDVDLVRLGCTNVSVGRETIGARVYAYHERRTDVTFSMQVVYVKGLTPMSAIATVRGGTSNTAGLHWSLGMVKQPEGNWLIAYEHQSWPDCPPGSAYHTGGSGRSGVDPDSID
jgi:uncharacterized protein (TIGR02246 family)